MQYVEMVRLGLTVLAFVIDLIKDAKENEGQEAQSDVAVDKGLELLGQIGSVAKVKELNIEEMKMFAPELKLLVEKIKGLKK